MAAEKCDNKRIVHVHGSLDLSLPSSEMMEVRETERRQNIIKCGNREDSVSSDFGNGSCPLIFNNFGLA